MLTMVFTVRKSFKTEEENEISDIKIIKPEKLILKIADLHDSLCEVVGKVNKCFAFEVDLFLKK